MPLQLRRDRLYTIAMIDETQIARDGFWVFGYGSLIWRPGFDYTRREKAELTGYRRAFCMRSIHYRGTEQAPGLVLALEPDQAASCHGLAYHVAAENAVDTLQYLRDRELISYAYVERVHALSLAGGDQITALCYVMNTDHAQYAGHLSLNEQSEIIAHAHGSVGPNRDYLFSTLEHLHELGIDDPDMAELAKLVEQIG